MSSRAGRERFRRDHMPPAPSSSSRFDEKPRGSSNHSNPPSRHLWVGNISHHVSQSTLADHFLRFGVLENVAFQPGRSYAFINFKREEDAIAAMNALQGLNLAGLPLRVEFAKADKSSAPSRNDNYLQRRDELRSTNRSSPFSQRESRMRHASPDAFLADDSRGSSNNAEPLSEVLWIGFPSQLKVDETILRKAFSPFGEIEKISVFPGRSYAFVRFRSLTSACRAKETLQGKLFGNPRVHICFAKSETGSSNSGRRSSGYNAPPSPHFTNGRAGSSDNHRPDRDFGNYPSDHAIRRRHFVPDVEYGEPDVMSLGMKEPLWRGGDAPYELKRFNELGSELGVPDGLQGYHNNPVMTHEFSPQKFPKRSPLLEEPWDSPEHAHVYHEAKRLKTGPFPPEKELPEYPFSETEQGRQLLPRMFSEVPPPNEPAPVGYRQILDHPPNLPQSFVDRRENWKAPPDTLHPSAGSSSNPVEWKRLTPDLHQPPINVEWKWEGIIAKGGTAVCRARCFPVGRVLDIMLPEFLDCTARTGLDMLAKHYYQAAGTWVVFFVPQSDADIGYYNEFMNYLGEKQRAAVAKIDDKNTLFLVPPSDFSEKVLKVPGKLSISGVVLRLEPPSSNLGSASVIHERKDANIMPSLNDALYMKSGSSSGSFPSIKSYPSKPGFSNPPLAISASAQGTTSSFLGYDHTSESMPESMEKRQEYPSSHQSVSGLGRNWSPHQLRSPVPRIRTLALQTSQDAVGPGQGPNMGSYNGGFTGSLPVSNKLPLEETKPSASLSTPLGGLQPEQLAQLATSLLGQQMQSGSTSVVSGRDDLRSSSMNHPENLPRAPQRYTSDVPPEPPASQFVQLQQPPQAVNMQAVPQTQVNQQLTGSGNTQDDGEADPQKRLQATLQLAAALLQQIQQGKGT
ncbi:hypothetical protein Ancab_008227 [Ancistrocladus abbreviatus]